MLPRGVYMLLGTVRQRATNEIGAPIGTTNDNPILDTRVYEVALNDDIVLEYSANVIAENLYSQVNQEGHLLVLLDLILNHKKSHAEETSNFITVKDRKCRRVTTKGWKLCVRWNKLGDSCTAEGIKPNWSCIICSYSRNRRRTSPCLVDAIYPEEKTMDCFKVK
jgi:hypothetical protein